MSRLIHYDSMRPESSVYQPHRNDARYGTKEFVKALLTHNDKGVTGIYARWRMFEEEVRTGFGD